MLHPHAHLTTPGIDVFHGGTESEALKESARLASDCIKFIPKDKRVLLINTLVDAQSLEEVIGAHARRAPRLRYETYLESTFMDKLEMLEKSITDMNVAVLLITNFDCAALTQRHRVLLGQRLRAIRNTHKIRIIVFMQNRPGYYGVNGSLRYASRMMTEVGAWRGTNVAEANDEIAERSNALEEKLAIELAEEQAAAEREEQERLEAEQRLLQRRAIVMNKYGLLNEEQAEAASKIIMSDPIDEHEEVELLAGMVKSFDNETFSNFLGYFQGNFDTEPSLVAKAEFLRRRGHGQGYVLQPRPASANVLQAKPLQAQLLQAQPLQAQPLKNNELAYADVA